MVVQTTSAALRGMEITFVEVQADFSDGLPVFDMVGLLNSEVKEARERVRSALRSAGYRLPPKRITVNLSPADLRKEGAAFDLAIAIALLKGISVLPPDCSDSCIMLGELRLDGLLSPVTGSLPAALAAQKAGYHTFLLPAQNVPECAPFVSGLRLIGLHSLQDAVSYLKDGLIPELGEPEFTLAKPAPPSIPDFFSLSGQEVGKRAALLSAAGEHHLLLCGPPGVGKSLLARCIPGILPPLDEKERLFHAELSSLRGQTDDGLPPFRAPASTVTERALIGGGPKGLPGEVTYAHGGILFLDELPAFSSRIITALRRPMEERQVTLLTRDGNICYPADFLLVATMNPGPCGYYPDRQRCNCTPDQIHRYRRRLDGPLLDRLDLYLEMRKPKFPQLEDPSALTTGQLRDMASAARERQRYRYRKESFSTNGQLPGEKIAEYCPLMTAEKKQMMHYYEKYQLSARGYHKVLRVARTIADLEEAEQITSDHLREAVYYRGMDRMQEVDYIC